MVKNPTAAQNPAPTVAAAIELLMRQGYNATSVDDLADAAGISRSTFFRKFGSKEDMVFSDHERILARVKDVLSTATVDPLNAVVRAALTVFDQHVHNRETSLLRNELLREVPTLRDRELVTTHRYERSFRHYLQAALPEADGRDVGAVAFAAAVVAVHNKALRQWLRDAGSSAEEGYDTRASTQLARDLQALVQIFRPSLLPSAVPDSPRPTVLVTVLDPGAGTGQILEAVRKALE